MVLSDSAKIRTLSSSTKQAAENSVWNLFWGGGTSLPGRETLYFLLFRIALAVRTLLSRVFPQPAKETNLLGS
jgi:hypothetical protein